MSRNKSLFIFTSVIVVFVIIAFVIYRTQLTNSKNSVRIGFLVPKLENQFFVDMTESAKSMENENLKVFVQASDDPLIQNQIIENFITQGVDAICVVPINSESIIPAVKEANVANILIINVDNKINLESANQQGAKISLYIGSDNFEGGQMAGNFIIEKLNEKGKVAILEGVAGNDAAIKRKGGFEDALKSAPDIKIVSSQVADWNREKAKNIFQAIIVAHPDLNAVFACNDEMALGVIAALKAQNIPLDKIIVVGFDAINEAITAVNNGELSATIAQQPKLMGKNAIELTIKLLKGEKINSSYSTPLKIIK